MLKRLLPAVAAFVTACGGDVPDFTGQWSGNLLQSSLCDDGTTIPRVVPVTLAATQDDKGVNFTSNTSCGVIRGDFDGDFLRIQPAACAPLVSGDFTYGDTILGGTIVLRDDELRVSANVSTVLVTPTGAGRCSGPMSGGLTRVE